MLVAIQKLGLQGAQCYSHQGGTRRKMLDRQPPVSAIFFSVALSGNRLHKFIQEHGGANHFSFMTLDEYAGKGLKDSALMCEVFYKKNMKDKHAHTLWHTLYEALCQCRQDHSPWNCSVRGYNEMQLAFHAQSDAIEFFKSAAVETIVFPEFDKEEVMVLNDALGEMNQEAIGASLQSAGLSTTHSVGMGWNLGKPHDVVCQITGTGLMGRT